MSQSQNADHDSKPEQYEQPNEPRFERSGQPNAQCPDCGCSEVEKIEPANAVARRYPERSECQECGHSAHPLAFSKEYEQSQLSADEREAIRRLEDRQRAKQAEANLPA